MLKKFILALGIAVYCTALLSSVSFASELSDEKVMSTMDMESINNSLNKVGLKSVSLNPAEESVFSSHVSFGNGSSAFSTLEDGSSADSYRCYIKVSTSEFTQNNVVTFNLPSYGQLGSSYSILSGNCDSVELNGRVLKVYNPHDSVSGNASDVIISVPFTNAYINTTGSPITLSLGGIVQVFSSGTELIDTLTQFINVPSIVHYVALVMSAIIGIVFMWWGVRKLISALMGALRTGRAGA